MPLESVRNAICILALSLAAKANAAQQPTADPAASASKINYEWSPGDSDKIRVVLLASPKRSRICHVVSYNSDELRCAQSDNRLPAIYHRDQVVALIRPESHENIALQLYNRLRLVRARLHNRSELRKLDRELRYLHQLVRSGASLGEDSGDDTPAAILYLAPGQTLQIPLK